MRLKGDGWVPLLSSPPCLVGMMVSVKRSLRGVPKAVTLWTMQRSAERPPLRMLMMMGGL